MRFSNELGVRSKQKELNVANLGLDKMPFDSVANTEQAVIFQKRD